MALDDAAWAEMHQVYCDTTITVREITERFRITSRQLYARRVSESWPTLSTPTCPPTMPGAVPTPPAAPLAAKRW